MNSEATRTHPMPSFWSLSAEGEQKALPQSVNGIANGKEEPDPNVYYLRTNHF